MAAGVQRRPEWRARRTWPRQLGPLFVLSAWMVKSGGTDGWLEHLRQWLGAQWPGLSPWVS